MTTRLGVIVCGQCNRNRVVAMVPDMPPEAERERLTVLAVSRGWHLHQVGGAKWYDASSLLVCDRCRVEFADEPSRKGKTP